MPLGQSSGRSDISNVSSSNVTKTDDALRHGNYLLSCWDVATLRTGEIYQIGMFLPHGVHIMHCIRPDHFSERDMEQSDVFSKVGMLW